MSQPGNLTGTVRKPNHPTLSGADLVVESLVRHGVSVVFAYPGAATIPLHQAFLRYQDRIRVVLPRHEQGGGFAAQGYARSTGRLGVCITTSGPGATNLVTAIADAKMDSVPMLAVTGQVDTTSIGYDAFQETPITEVCRSITKHHCLVTDTADLIRVLKEAIFIATTGRPGPVLVDIPKNVLTAMAATDFDVAMNLPGYSGVNPTASDEQIRTIADAIAQSNRPVMFAGGGVVGSDAARELTKLARTCRIPTTTTLMGLTAFPQQDELSLGMPGMHGTYYANHAIRQCDLLLACGVRLSDRATGNIREFAKDAKIVHVDIDPAELEKNKPVAVPVIGDICDTLVRLNRIVQPAGDRLDAWLGKIVEWRESRPIRYPVSPDFIQPQQAIETLRDMTRALDLIVTTGVGQHQMWSAQYFRPQKPRTFLTSGGLGTMGFGLPAAIGAKLANPEKTVITIDGDGSLLMNVQEMATSYCENVPVKLFLLNNQHLGMVAQHEDRFFAASRGNTYLGPIERYHANEAGFDPHGRYPNFVGIAKSFHWGARSVVKPDELPDAIREMLAFPGSFLLDVAVPYHEHVLPMIPAGGTVADIIWR